MSTITISRGSYSYGKKIAEKLAEKLGYQCISREVIIKASEQFNLPEIKLKRAIHDAPSILDRFTFGKEKFTCYVRKTLLSYARKDNIVYHGMAGHFFVKDIPNVLKVRIVANIEDRIMEEMKQKNISEEKARDILVKDDEERKRWSMFLYGIDTNDPNLYDVVLHVDRMQLDDIVEILFTIAKRPCFQTTPESIRILDNMLLSAQIKSALISKFPKAVVNSRNGEVNINIESALSQTDGITKQIENMLQSIDGIKEIEIHYEPYEALK